MALWIFFTPQCDHHGEYGMTKNKTARALNLCAAVLLAGLAACTPGRPFSPQDWVFLPADAVVGAGDPTRAAIINSAYAYATPSSLAGRPAEAAVAVAQLDYLASEIPYGARWREFDPTVGLLLQRARQEVRGYLGISQDAAPQVVVDALFAASRALRANDRAAAERILAPPVFPNARQTLAHLTALPLLPTANQATARAQQELDRMTRGGGRGSPGGGGGGGGGRG
jgi:hypothetical protein